ncbi:MAG: ATP-dependent DNA helicase [Patescibacteria group bacterium]|nr:ATP-dependent helicase [Patescibacteria group bacterium]
MNKNFFLKEYKKLNAGQKKAVDALRGPVMVLAGPGTGKTQVLGMRIANIVYKKKARPKEILALTFSGSAAVSMRKRVAGFLGDLAYEVEIKTFHAFCNDIILENPDRFASGGAARQLDELGVTKRIKGIIKRGKFRQLKPFFDPFFYKKEIVSSIGELKREGVLAADFFQAVERFGKELEAGKKINKRTGKPTLEWQKNKRQAERLEDLAAIYGEYLRLNHKKGEYDFSDMVIRVVEAFKKDSELREEYRTRFKYILSDEFQDANAVQNQVIERLGRPKDKPNIFVVGDDDQAIYRFQGASLDNILFFEKRYPGARIITINVNYRSNQRVIDVFSRLIEKNRQRLVNISEKNIEKNIKQAPARAGLKKLPARSVNLYEFSSGEVEDFFIAQKVKALRKKGVALKQMAVILRTNKEVEEIADYLIKAGISVEMSGTGSVLEKKEVQALVKLLELIADVRNNLLAWEVMSGEVWKIPPADFLRFCYLAGRAGGAYVDYFLKIKVQGKNLKWKNFSRLESFWNKILSWHKAGASTPVVVLLERAINESGLLDQYMARKDIRGLNRIASFFSYVRERNRKQPELVLAEILKDIKIMRDDRIAIREKELSMAYDDVRILTAHAAKGMEFEAVFIPRLYRGAWDGRRINQMIKLPWENLGFSSAKKGQGQAAREEEERRLFFVALSRAKNMLFLSRADKYELFGDVREKAPSKFLIETQGDLAKEKVEIFEDKFLERLKVELKFPEEEKEKEKFLKLEENFLRRRVENLTLSPTSLNLYLDCPKKYKYEKLLLVPKIKSKSLCLGTAAHKALEDFFLKIKKQGKAEIGVLLNSFSQALEREIMLKQDKKQVEDEGRKILQAYFDEYKGSFKKPLALETSFSKVFLDGAGLTGKVDKIEPAPAGGHGGKLRPVKVTDYKTGQAKTRNDILGKTKYSHGDIYRQLVFYKLLSMMDRDFSYFVKEVEVDFIKADKGRFRKESFVIGEKQAEQLKGLIRQVIKKIKSLDFSPCRDKRKCQRCELNKICDKDEE